MTAAVVLERVSLSESASCDDMEMDGIDEVGITDAFSHSSSSSSPAPSSPQSAGPLPLSVSIVADGSTAVSVRARLYRCFDTFILKGANLLELSEVYDVSLRGIQFRGAPNMWREWMEKLMHNYDRMQRRETVVNAVLLFHTLPDESPFAVYTEPLRFPRDIDMGSSNSSPSPVSLPSYLDSVLLWRAGSHTIEVQQRQRPTSAAESAPIIHLKLLKWMLSSKLRDAANRHTIRFSVRAVTPAAVNLTLLQFAPSFKSWVNIAATQLLLREDRPWSSQLHLEVAEDDPVAATYPLVLNTEQFVTQRVTQSSHPPELSSNLLICAAALTSARSVNCVSCTSAIKYSSLTTTSNTCCSVDLQGSGQAMCIASLSSAW